MTTIYCVRKVCETETGDGKGWHYFEAEQQVVDDTITCPDHPQADTRDFTIVETKDVDLSDYAAYKAIIRSAIEFFNEIMTEFAGENISLGITQAGKTKDVADYLADVLRYGQTGSLYEVMSECDRLISEGIPAGLSPFVTETRLTTFKGLIQDYLS